MTNSARTLVLGLVIATAIAPAWAGNWADDKDWPDLSKSKQICAQLRHIALPDPNRPDRRQESGLAECDSQALYFGIGQPADPAQAFACASAEGNQGPFTGDFVLMEIYANGKGAPANLDMAMALACTIGGAAAEIDGRVLHLAERKAGAKTDGDFSWCDDITSGLAMAACAHLDERLSKAAQDQSWAGFLKIWAAQADALTKLRESHDRFSDLRGDLEVDQSGTARSAMTIAMRSGLRQQIVDDLDALAHGVTPWAPAAKATGADQRLNATYRTIMKIPPEHFGQYQGTVKQADIKATQRAWLKYRDAWVAFATALDPAQDGQAIINWLTLRRVEDLEAFAGP